MVFRAGCESSIDQSGPVTGVAIPRAFSPVSPLVSTTVLMLACEPGYAVRLAPCAPFSPHPIYLPYKAQFMSLSSANPLKANGQKMRIKWLKPNLQRHTCFVGFSGHWVCPTVLALHQGLLNIVIFAVFALVDLRPRKQELLHLALPSPSPWWT